MTIFALSSQRAARRFSNIAAVIAVSSVSLFWGCGDPCGGTAISLSSGSAPAPPPYNGIECSGSLHLFRFCTEPTRPVARMSDCGGIELQFNEDSGGLSIHLHADGGEVNAAAVRLSRWSDVEPGSSEISRVVGGWIAPRAFSVDPMQHHAGAFSIEFEDGQLAGTYDSLWPEIGSWYVVGRMQLFETDSSIPRLSHLGDNRLGQYLHGIPGMAAAVEQSAMSHDALVAIGLSGTERGTYQGLEAGSRLLADPDGDPSNNFDGLGTLAPLTPDPPAVIPPGYIMGGGFHGGGLGDLNELVLPLLLSPDGTTLDLRLQSAGLHGTIVPDSWDGQFGGTLGGDEVKATLLPAMVASFNQTIETQCGAGCPAGSAAEWLLGELDANGDAFVSLDELTANAGLRQATTLNVDTDLDGIADSLSLGLAFSAVPVAISEE